MCLRRELVFVDAGGDIEGGEAGGEAVALAHSADSTGYRPFAVPGSQEAILGCAVANVEEASFSGVPVEGLGEDDGALNIESGARMLKIWSSDCCIPYESNGSGTDCSIGSMIGSEL